MSQLYEVTVDGRDDPALAVAEDEEEAIALVARKGIGMVRTATPISQEPDWDWDKDPVFIPPEQRSSAKWPVVRRIISAVVVVVTMIVAANFFGWESYGGWLPNPSILIGIAAGFGTYRLLGGRGRTSF